MLYNMVMSTYYQSWLLSESARDRVILIMFVCLLVQTAVFNELARVLPAKLVGPARYAYLALCTIGDAAIALALGVAIL